MLLVDTNVWLAAADSSSKDHQACATLLAECTHELASTVPVIAETGWLLLDRAGPDAQRRFLAMIATRRVGAVDLIEEDWLRVHELVGTYADLRLDVVDASTMAVAERLGERQIATLDERDFRVVIPDHADAFELLPRS